MVEPKLKVPPPLTVGNPAAAASLAIDQSHMEDFTNAKDEAGDVQCRRPPKGIYFTVRKETVEPWKDRKFYFLLQIEGRDPYIVAPHIAKLKQEEDTIRPILIVRYVTMGGEEGLWPLKLDPPDGKSNRFNKSALTVLEKAEDEKWVRIMSTKKHYTYSVSRKTFEETPPRFSDRPFDELINEAFKDRVVTDLNHEIWDVLENGSDR